MSDDRLSVCILAAGKGTRMGDASSWLPKPLLPIAGKAMVSHAIDCVPAGLPIVVAVGHEADTVAGYIEHAHPDRQISVVRVKNYDGPGSGPGASLLECKPSLPGPFIVWAVDALFDDPDELPLGDADLDWICVADVDDVSRFCAVETHEDVYVSSLRDKSAVGPGSAFVGVASVHDVDTFWSSLIGSVGSEGELQLSHGLRGLIKNGLGLQRVVGWRDAGTHDGYAMLTPGSGLPKPDEATYDTGSRIVKSFRDVARARSRASRARLLSHVCPRPIVQSGGYMSYAKVQGKTAYEALPEDADITARFFAWARENLWKPMCPEDEFVAAMDAFYRKKTLARLDAFFAANSSISRRSAHRVNCTDVAPCDDLVASVDWDSLSRGIPANIHGDLQFDNVIVSHDGSFTLIDWREDFGGLSYGDVYYDLAKLYGGLTVSYNAMKHSCYAYSADGNAVTFSFASPEALDAARSRFVDLATAAGYDMGRIAVLRGIVYLNMAPLHAGDVGRLFFYAGLLHLQRALERYA